MNSSCYTTLHKCLVSYDLYMILRWILNIQQNEFGIYLSNMADFMKSIVVVLWDAIWMYS